VIEAKGGLYEKIKRGNAATAAAYAKRLEGKAHASMLFN
jgi:hypothetical protein